MPLDMALSSSNSVETFDQEGCKVKIEEGSVNYMTVNLIGKITHKQKLNEYAKDHAPDVKLQGGPEKAQIQAHREVLKDGIPYFKAMFSNHFQESSQSVIDLGDDIPFETVTKLIDFVYKGALSVSAPDIQDVFQLADQWGMANIKNICCSFMIRELDATNCLDLLQLAQMHSCEELIKPCKHVIAQQFQAVSYTLSFLELPALFLAMILQLDNLNAGPLGEEFILDAVIRWYHHDEKTRCDSLADVLCNVVMSCITDKVKRKYLEDPALICLQDVKERVACNTSEEKRCHLQHFLVICGYLQSRTGPTCPRTETVEQFDPSTCSFIECKGLPQAPSYGTSFNLLGKIVYVAVHVYPDPVLNKRMEQVIVWTYNTLVNRWWQAPEVFSKVALDHIGKCLLNGGTVVYCSHQNTIYAVMVDESVCIDVHCTDGEIFCDIRARLPSLLSHLEHTHYNLKGIAHKGRLYVMGGYFGPEMERVYSSTVLMLSEDGTCWEKRADMLIPRTDFSVVSHGDHIFVTGGYGGRETRRRQQSCECYSVEHDQWHAIPQMKQSRSHHCTVVVNNKMYTIGGKSYASQKLTGMGGWHPGGARIVSDFVEMIDPTLLGSDGAEWVRLARMTKSRCNFTTVVF